MDYLRSLRRRGHCKDGKDQSSKDQLKDAALEYSPNSRHCIYGLDADLVMLALASHELHFVILREEIVFALHEQESLDKRNRRRLSKHHAFELLHLSVLREYLLIEFGFNHGADSASDEANERDFERIVNDFVFLSMFVGNDFIPHSPTVNIATRGLEVLLNVYKQCLAEWAPDAYILNGTRIDVANLKDLCARLADIEAGRFLQQLHFLRLHKEKEAKRKFSYFPMLAIEKSAHFRQLSVEELDADISELEHNDLNEEGTLLRFRQKYYAKRWGTDVAASEAQRKQICLDYVRGLQWNVNYYYHGCCSWSYFNRHHYAPRFCDMALIDEKDERDLAA